MKLENKQEFIKGVIAGLIAGIALFIFIESFRWMGLTKFGASYLAGDIVFTFKNNFGMNVLAFFISNGISIFFTLAEYH
jgi:hypothetical protein